MSETKEEENKIVISTKNTNISRGHTTGFYPGPGKTVLPRKNFPR